MQQQADARVLEAARAAWAEGEAERRAAAAMLEEARAEAAKAKVTVLATPYQVHHAVADIVPSHGLLALQAQAETRLST